MAFERMRNYRSSNKKDATVTSRCFWMSRTHWSISLKREAKIAVPFDARESTFCRRYGAQLCDRYSSNSEHMRDDCFNLCFICFFFIFFVCTAWRCSRILMHWDERRRLEDCYNGNVISPTGCKGWAAGARAGRHGNPFISISESSPKEFPICLFSARLSWLLSFEYFRALADVDRRSKSATGDDPN